MAEATAIDWADKCVLESRPDPEMLKNYRKAGPVPPGVEFMMPIPWLGRLFLTGDHVP